MSETQVKINRKLPNGDRLVITIDEDGETHIQLNDITVVWVDPEYLRPDVGTSNRDDKLAVHLYAINKDEPLSLSIADDHIELHSDDGKCLKDLR